MDAGAIFASKQWFTNICLNSYIGFGRNDVGFVTKYGKRKAFHAGGNLSCRQHIRQHYEVYQQQCKAENIPEHHWAIPRAIWRKTQDEKNTAKGERQGTLDELMKKPVALLVFTRENVLHSVTQFIAVDDQVNTHQGSKTKILTSCHSPFLSQIKQHFETAWLQCVQSWTCKICRQLVMLPAIFTMNLLSGSHSLNMISW